MSRKAVIIAVLVSAFVFKAQTLVVAQETGQAGSAMTIDYENDLLSLDARDVPLGRVLQAIGRAAGLETPQTLDTVTRFTGRFAGLSLSEGLARILGQQASFIMKYDGGGRPQRLVILAMPNAGATADNAPANKEIAFEWPADEAEADDGEAWIRSQLAATDPSARITAIWQLRGLPADAASAIAVNALRIEFDARVRARIASLLGQVGGPRATGVLADLLIDPSAHVQQAAVWALAGADDDSAYHALGLALLRQLSGESLRLMIVDVLAASRSEIANDYLKMVSLGLGGPVAREAQDAISGHLAIEGYRTSSADASETTARPVRSSFLTAAKLLDY